MRSRALRILLLAAMVVSLFWLVVDPSPEPLIAAITGLAAFLSLRLTKAEQTPFLPDLRPSRIAVLPLRNIPQIADNEYFAAGLTEELISVLSRVRELEVIAASSTGQYRGASRPLSEIASELRVGTVLEGSVRNAAEALRISVRLVDVRSQTTLWADDYDRDLREVFSVQREIASEVARALSVTIVPDEKARIAKAPTSDLEAYDLYLLGRHELNKRSEDGIRRSVDRFQAAVAKDPAFAAAYAGIADAYVLALIGYAPILATSR